MKKIILITCLILGARLALYSQYIGGGGSGYSNTELNQTVCLMPNNTNVFFGGQSDGFSLSTLTQNACPPIVNENIFFGGRSDGFANSVIIQVCCPVTGSIYHISNDW